MRTLSIVVALALVGCGTPQKPRIEVRETKVPVAVKCTTAVPPKPEYATQALTLQEGIYDLVRALLIELDQRRIREGELEAALEGCR